MSGLRGRSTQEFGLMRSKLERRTLNRKALIEQAIKDNQLWNTRFHNATKKKEILIGFKCLCENGVGMKTISEEYNYCRQCNRFYGRTAFSLFKYL